MSTYTKLPQLLFRKRRIPTRFYDFNNNKNHTADYRTTVIHHHHHHHHHHLYHYCGITTVSDESYHQLSNHRQKYCGSVPRIIPFMYSIPFDNMSRGSSYALMNRNYYPQQQARMERFMTTTTTTTGPNHHQDQEEFVDSDTDNNNDSDVSSLSVDHHHSEAALDTNVLKLTKTAKVTPSSVFSDEWIPPDRPLLGDVGQAHLYAHIEEDKELRELLSAEDEDEEEANESPTTTDTDSSLLTTTNMVEEAEQVISPPSIDWLKTRRTMLQGQTMMKPDAAAIYKQSMTDLELPIIEHTLFSENELVQFIQAIGGQDIQVVLDHADLKKGGRRRMGQDVMGIILVTGSNYIQMRNMATQIVRQLRRRKLQEVEGVMGADLGVDGNLDDPNENWYVVDCGNYIIHIQDTKTRTAVNLAGLWSGNDPIRKVDCTNDDAMDEYVAQYPVPQNYMIGGSISPSSTLLYDVNHWDATMKQFEKSRWARGNTNLLNAASNTSSSSSSSGMSSTRFRNKPIVPKRRRKTSGRKT